MDPIYPWLDPIEVRRLADRLMRPERQSAVTVPDAGFDDGFVGFAGAQPFLPAQQQILPPQLPPQIHVREEPAPAPFQAPPQAQTPVPVAAPEPEMEPEPIQPPAPPQPQPQPQPVVVVVEENQTTARGPFLDRITRFRDWMRHNFSATGIFILDRDGAVIFDESSHGRLHFLARSLALASRKTGSSGGNVHVKIGAGATLEVIPVDTPYGCLVLGAVVPDSLSPPSVGAVMEALAQVASPPA